MTRIQRTFIASKYTSMLFSGTVLMVLTALMGTADTLIAGIVLGENAVTGVCLVLPIYALASFFAVSFSYGVPILYARETGAFRKAEADRCFGVGLTVTLLVGILMFAAILIGGGAYLRLFGGDGPAYESGSEYLRWMKYAVLILPLNELLDGMVFADGDETLTLAANLTQGLVKLALSVVFCRTMGVKGLAVASVIGFAVSVGISCLHFLRPGNTLKLNLAFSPKLLGSIIRFGIVDASTHLFVSLFTFAISFFMAVRFGTRMVVLVSVITLLREGQIVFEGIGEAITPIISVYLGEGTCPGVRRVWTLARRSQWIESLLCTGLLLALAPWIVGLLGIEDPVTALYAVWGLRLQAVTLIFTCTMFLDSSYFILVDRISLGVFDSLLRELFPALPMAVVGGLVGGIYGMFIGLMLAPPLGYLLSLAYIVRRYGRENYPLFLAGLERGRRVELIEFRVTPDAIIRARDQIGDALKRCACPDRQINRTMLLFEELFMIVHECNPGRTVLAECTVEIGEVIRLITKDNGRIVDLTDSDRDLSSLRSLRSYTLSNLLEAYTTQRVHMLALSYNRNALEIR